MNLSIEEPCHENWNAMTQQEQGRYCGSCCKTVFDFTQMPTEEVIQFIASRKKDSVCGRFTSEQVIVPATAKAQLKVSWTFKKFLAAIVMVFGGALFTSCGNEPMGKLVNIESTDDSSVQAQLPDTTIPKVISADTVPQKVDTVKKMYKGKVACEVPKDEVRLDQQVFVGLTVLDVPADSDTLK